MKIVSNPKSDPNRILSWADVNVQNDNGQPSGAIKRITLKVEAGDIATLEIEEYGIDNADMKDGSLNMTINACGEGPVTTIKEYCVDKICIEAKDMHQIVSESKDQEIDELKQKKNDAS